MKKKERKARLREKARATAEAAVPRLTGVTVGGPKPGNRFEVNLKSRAHIVTMPESPWYVGAVYAYTKTLTKLGEMVALYTHCLPRK